LATPMETFYYCSSGTGPDCEVTSGTPPVTVAHPEYRRYYEAPADEFGAELETTNTAAYVDYLSST